MIATEVHRQAAIGVLLILQVIFIIVYAFVVKYAPAAMPSKEIPATNGTTEEPLEAIDELNDTYPLFQDIHVMIFVGFGFLVTFLKKYAYSGVGFTFFVAALAVEWAILVHGFFTWGGDHKIYVGLEEMIYAEEAAATVLISLGIVLGKVPPFSLVVMTLVEIFAFAANEHLCVDVLEAMDWGGSVYLHAFGAYFGFGMSFILAIKTNTLEVKPEESGTYIGDVTAMIGTLFLWIFWPSFLAAGFTGDKRYRVIINTYLALLSSCLVAFAMSAALSKQFKFGMPQVQNATLAGGVTIGTTCVTMIYPYGALIIGAISGAVSSIGFAYIQGFLRRKCHIHDTCGAHNLHGMPGILGGLAGVITVAFADRNTYESELDTIFPAMGKGRSEGMQAMYQLIGIFVTFAISGVAGILTGVIIRFTLPQFSDDLFYKDEEWWEGEGNAEDA